MSSFNPNEYWEKRLRAISGLHGVGYLGLGTYYNNWLYRVRRRVFLRHVRFLADNWTKVNVLDIGSGTGYYIDCWKSLGVRSVTATDITAIAVEELRKKFPGLKCYQVDIGDNLPEVLHDKQYHIISAFAVLYHIVDDARYLTAFENIFQLLRPGGYLIFTENFVHGNAVRSQHQVSRSLDDIEGILKGVGFKVKARVPLFAIMNYPVDSNSSIFKIIWRGMMVPVRILQPLGFVLGALLYPFELMLTLFLKEGPSTELMICEKDE